MPRNAGRNSVLVVLLCETRAWELTLDRLGSNLLDVLDADLALCVGDHESHNPLYDRARHIWRLEEPDDWAEAFDRAAGDSSWRTLLEISDQFLGGVQDAEHPQVGSGAIGTCFREFLRQSLAREGILDDYDWIVITRSDFLWPVSHPAVRHLSDRRIYVLDGEQHGGVCDRHFVVPRRFFEPVLGIVDPVFRDPAGLKRRIQEVSEQEGWSLMNVERLHAMRLRDLGLWRRLGYLPYVPYTVRAPGGSSRWSTGEFDEQRGYYIKYPLELERSKVAQRFVGDQDSWAAYLAPFRGVLPRHRLKREYAARDLYERAFSGPTMREVLEPGASWLRRATIRLDRAAARVGRVLRRIPGMPAMLDRRVRRLERRADRRRSDL